MNKNVRTLSLIGILGALSCIAMLIEIPTPFNAWLKFDISEAIVLYGALVGGPVAGISIAVLKSVLNFLLQGSTTGGVGEIAAAVSGIAYALPAFFTYKKTEKIIPSLVVGTLSLTILLTFANYIWITPFYAKLYKMDFILNMMGTNLYLKYVLATYIPFNLLKGAVVSLVYFFIHKSLKKTYNI